MSSSLKRLVAVVVTLSCAAMVVPTAVRADPGSSNPQPPPEPGPEPDPDPGTGVFAGDGDIGAVARDTSYTGGHTGGEGDSEGTATPAPPPCTWTPVTWGDFRFPGVGRPPWFRKQMAASGGSLDSAIYRDASAPGGGFKSSSSPNSESLYERSCPGDGGTGRLWVPPAEQLPSVEELRADAYERVAAQIPAPGLNMNPEPSVGGVVNIGLWLAVEDPGAVTASAGPRWATVTASYESVSWSMGNGDSVECAGLGVPISDLDTVEQGPCGYTYRWPSAPKFTGTDDLAYHNSVTGHWAINYATSDGTSGSLGTVDQAAEFSYQVREIQTVRVSE